MEANREWMPGDREAAGAIEGMRIARGLYSQTGLVVGDPIYVRRPGWESAKRCQVIEVLDEGFYEVLDAEGGRHHIWPEDVMPF